MEVELVQNKSVQDQNAVSKARYDEAEEKEATQPDVALQIYYKLIHDPSFKDEKLKEQAIYKLGGLYTKLGRGEELSKLLVTVRPFFATISKAKTAKIVRTLIDELSTIPGVSVTSMIDLCKESIAWAKEEKRTFLRQRIEVKLASLYHDNKEYNGSITLLTNLLREVKRLDDKSLLVEIQLLESRVQHSLRNLPKAKAALTAARTAANSIYVRPPLQAEIDLQAGTLHTEEKDYKTAYSYFYESFETYSGLDDPLALTALKYMLLAKVMLSLPDDAFALLNSGKLALKYQGPEIDAMRAIANSLKTRSLKDFETATKKYGEQINSDPLLKSHLSNLYETLLQENLCRIIEPFSKVEIAHIAHLIELSLETVEKKLSQMILDKKFAGILDQGNGTLIVFDEAPNNKTFNTSLDTIEHMSRVVDSLYEKINLLRH